MDIKIFEEYWNPVKRVRDNPEEYWDSRAKEFNSHKGRGSSTKRQELLISMLKERKFISPEYSAIDIGCGSGQHAISFAKEMKHVTALDISPKMIEYAKDNAKQEGLENTEFLALDWHKANFDTLNWRKRFDLVFASMTPAINSKQDLEKMISLSKRYCCLCTFAARFNSLNKGVSKITNIRSDQGNLSFFYTAFNMLYLMGYFPDVIFLDSQFTLNTPTQKAIENEIEYAKRVQDISKDTECKIIEYIKSVEKNGVVDEEVTSKTAWMFWAV